MKNKKSIRELYLSVETGLNDDLVLMDSYREIVNRRNEKKNCLKSNLQK